MITTTNEERKPDPERTRSRHRPSPFALSAASFQGVEAPRTSAEHSSMDRGFMDSIYFEDPLRVCE